MLPPITTLPFCASCNIHSISQPPDSSRQLATLCGAKLGLLGLIQDKLTRKSRVGRSVNLSLRRPSLPAAALQQCTCTQAGELLCKLCINSSHIAKATLASGRV